MVTQEERLSFLVEEFKKDSTVLLYTDGVTEARNIDGELFGSKRLVAALNEVADASP